MEGLFINFLCKDFVWLMLEVCGWVYRDSFKVLLDKFEWLVDLYGLDVLNYGFDWFLNWCRLMMVDGYFVYVIDKWCVFFFLCLRRIFFCVMLM